MHDQRLTASFLRGRVPKLVLKLLLKLENVNSVFGSAGKSTVWGRSGKVLEREFVVGKKDMAKKAKKKMNTR